MDEPIAAHGQLLHNLVLFGRVLRRAGVDVAPGQIKELAGALEYIDIGRRADFYAAACALLVHRRQDLARFDEAFAAFWRNRNYADPVRLTGELGKPLTPPPERTFRAPPARDAQAAGDARESDRVYLQRFMSYSPGELLRHKDFAEFTREEVEEARRLLKQMPWTIGRRPTRRTAPGGREVFDARAVLRRAVRTGGDPVEFQWKQKKDKPRQLVALCDISGSMEIYTRLLLHFLHAVAQAHGEVEAFVFATRLSRITRPLRLRDVDAALREVSRGVQDWSGGTRIGEAIKAFNFVWARRVLRPGAVALLISDGWDRGAPELLGREMARLARSVYQIIWLNPLAASPGYQPLTRGLQAALPHVDHFLAANNLANLEELLRLLAAIDREPGDKRKEVSLL